MPFGDLDSWLRPYPKASKDVLPLLATLADGFADFSKRWDALLSFQGVDQKQHQLPSFLHSLHQELSDSLRITSLRATQLHALYRYADSSTKGNATLRAQLEAKSLAAIQNATTVAHRRAGSYRVPARRVASWRRGPTSYNFGYLWTATNACE